MRRILTTLLACAVVAGAAAAPLSTAARAEIDVLMSKLEASGCEFNRNGNWYSGAEAKSQLLSKLKYFEDKGLVQSTEQFIELAASSSSATGQAYLVRCADGIPVQTRTWFVSQLQALRKAEQGARTPHGTPATSSVTLSR
jgi:hypothetical protein